MLLSDLWTHLSQASYPTEDVKCWGLLRTVPLNGVEVEAPSAIRTLILRSSLLHTPDMRKATVKRAAQGKKHPAINMVYRCNCVPCTMLGTVLVTTTLKQLGSDHNNQMLQWASPPRTFSSPFLIYPLTAKWKRSKKWPEFIQTLMIPQ